MKKVRIYAMVVMALPFLTGIAAAQVGINTDSSSPDGSSMLDVKSTTKGFLIPRMTAAERDAIASPATGLLIFCTDDNQYYSNRGTPSVSNWVVSSSQWITGGTNIYYPSGNVGIGTSSPSYRLHLVGGDMKIGNTSGDARKLYFGDGGNVYVGEEATDNRLGLFGTSLMINVGGTTGTSGQVLTSNGTICSWVTPSATGTGTTDYLARWLNPGTLGTGITRDDNNTVGINNAPDGSNRLKVNGAGNMTAITGSYTPTIYGSLGGSYFGASGQYTSDYVGYLGYQGYGVCGVIYAANVGNAGVYGLNSGSAIGVPGVYGYSNVSTSGTGYDLQSSVNGVAGNAFWGTAYHFGVYGTRYDDSGGPSAGVIGTVNYSNGGQPWGALGFQDASNVEYAGYFSGNIKLTGGLHDGTGYGISGSVLMSNGSNDVYWSAAAGTSGTGTASYIPKWATTSTLANSLFYDNGTNIGLGTTSPSAKLHTFSNGVSTAVNGQYNTNIGGQLGTSLYGAYGQSSGTLFGYLGSTNYGAYGQYNSSIAGYLGSTNYGAYGQNGASLYGYLGGPSYGAYGQNSAAMFGYLGGSSYGAYGQNGASLYGYLGGGNYGAYGQNGPYNGYLGGANYGAYGQSSSSLYGYLGGVFYGAYGQYSSTVLGYLGASGCGAYGQYNTLILGRLGTPNYGAYGQNSSTLYGYLGGNSYGAYGQYNANIYGSLGTSTSGVYGVHLTNGDYAGDFYHNGAPATFLTQWAVNAYMNNATTNDGSSYGYGNYNSGGIRGYNFNGATYSFGVAGWNYNDENRCGGILGANLGGGYWGSLGYVSSGNNTYGGYFTNTGTGTGKMAVSGADGIGIGAWGGLLGADIHGGIYGLYVEGDNFGIYSRGPVFSDWPAIQLQDVGEPERVVLFTNTSTDVTVMTSGTGQLVNGHSTVSFEENFRKVISAQVPVIITVTPTGNSNGVYISSSGTGGFSVAENNNGNSNVSFSYIAIGRRSGYENPQVPAEVIARDFESNMQQGLHNDADLSSNGKGLSYQDGRLRVGPPPSALNREPKKR